MLLLLLLLSLLLSLVVVIVRVESDLTIWQCFRVLVELYKFHKNSLIKRRKLSVYLS